jgi:uncharacterized protein (TIGR02246 family)
MNDEQEIESLYRALLGGWNRRNSNEMAALFTGDGFIIGFDGSSHNGQEEIRSQLGQIFADHPTPAFVAKIRTVRFLSPEVGVLRGVASMVAPGQRDIISAANAVQTIIAVKNGGRWRIAMFQNTPAAFHGRPELSEELTEELRRALQEEREGA